MSEYTKSSKATSNDLWGHQVAEGGKSRALRLREEEEAKGAVKVKYSGQQKGPWVPRAIKKMQRGGTGLAAEFNVDKPAAPAPARAAAAQSSSEAGASTSSFGGAADLDDLAEEEKVKPESEPKRQKVEEPKAPAVDPNRDEVAEGAPRLAQHIRSSAKFIKVSAMAYGLLEAKRVTEKNAAAFFEVLAAGMEDPHRLRDQTMRVAVRKLYASAIAKKRSRWEGPSALSEDSAPLQPWTIGRLGPLLRTPELRLTSWEARRGLRCSVLDPSRRHMFPPECELQLRVWQLHVLTQIELFTDDNFQFSRAAKTVREAIEGLPCVGWCIYPALEPPGAKHLPEGERPAWRDAIFDCVEACMLHHKHLWAKTTVDMVVKAMVDRRQNFSEEQPRAERALHPEQQRTLQEWNAKVKGQYIQRQQAYQQRDIHAKREQTSYERKEEEWHKSDITTAKGGDVQGGNIDNWLAKQSNN